MALLKKYFTIGILILTVMVIIAFAGLTVAVKYYRNESRRFKGNFEAEHDKSLEQNLTINELKKYNAGIVEELKEYKIKPRQVERIVQVQYQYRDTGTHTVEIKEVEKIINDTIYIFRGFEYNTGHIYLSGTVTDSAVMFNEISVTDTLLIVLTAQRECLFKPIKYQATAISKMKGDTMPILNNIQVIKKRGKPRVPY
jgi:hypothetical protein